MTANIISSRMAEFASGCRWEHLPDSTRFAAHRTLLNAMALGIGAAHHRPVDIAIEVLQALSSPPAATILGRRERLGITAAPLVNGMAVHVEDFDDTHLRTVVHPGAPIVPAVLAAAEHAGTSGEDTMTGLVAGVEVALRVANGISPEHFDRGWHLTGTVGHIGAAAAASRTLRLDPDRTAAAIALGATQAAGLTAARGSMTKCFHPGKAAADGIEAALLAAEGFTASVGPIDGHRGFGRVASPRVDFAEMVTGLGKTWEIEANAIKPYACGIVSHAAIDAAVYLRDKLGGSMVERLEVRVPRIVLEVMGIEDPVDGLQSKFSVHHGVAVGLLFGDGAPPQFSDELARAQDVVDLRRRVVAVIDDSLPKGAAHLRAWTDDGRVLAQEVRYATASAEYPMTDQQLARKVRGLVEPVLGSQAVEEVQRQCSSLESAPSVRALLMAATPSEGFADD